MKKKQTHGVAVGCVTRSNAPPTHHSPTPPLPYPPGMERAETGTEAARPDSASSASAAAAPPIVAASEAGWSSKTAATLEGWGGRGGRPGGGGSIGVV